MILFTGSVHRFVFGTGMTLFSSVTNSGTDTIKVFEMYFGTTQIDEDSLIELIDCILDPTDLSNPFASSTILFAGTPAASNITAPTIAAAAAKNITLTY
jgi:hypothetical protein